MSFSIHSGFLKWRKHFYNRSPLHYFPFPYHFTLQSITKLPKTIMPSYMICADSDSVYITNNPERQANNYHSVINYYDELHTCITSTLIFRSSWSRDSTNQDYGMLQEPDNVWTEAIVSWRDTWWSKIWPHRKQTSQSTLAGVPLGKIINKYITKFDDR